LVLVVRKMGQAVMMERRKRKGSPASNLVWEEKQKLISVNLMLTLKSKLMRILMFQHQKLKLKLMLLPLT